MLYTISKEDFTDHVRQSNNWNHLAYCCGYDFGRIKNTDIILYMKNKASNMKLNIDHFRGQNQVLNDDVFIKIVKESDCLYHVTKKCNSARGITRRSVYYNRRIKDLCIDTSHWKITSNRTTNKISKIMNMIDDETFKTIVKNNSNWTDLCQKCGYKK